MGRNVYQTHIDVNAECVWPGIGAQILQVQNVCMAKRAHPLKRRRPIFLRQWREHRGKTLVQVAEHIHMSHGQLSRIERGDQPYNEELLDVLADLYMCDPVDLLIRNPLNPDGIWSIWDRVPAVERPKALAVLEAFTRTGTDG